MSCLICARRLPPTFRGSLCDYCARVHRHRLNLALGWAPAGPKGRPTNIYQAFEAALEPLDPSPEPVAAPLIGHRLWRVETPGVEKLLAKEGMLEKMKSRWSAGLDPFLPFSSALLTGVGMHEHWLPGEDMCAVCMRNEPHTAPAHWCNCGIWAFKHPQRMMAKLSEWLIGQPVAFGEVRLWGIIHEHTWGWRAQYAEPVDLNVLYLGEEAVEEMALAYGCAVRAIDEPIEARRILAIRQERAARKPDPGAMSMSAAVAAFRRALASGQTPSAISVAASFTGSPKQLSLAMQKMNAAMSRIAAQAGASPLLLMNEDLDRWAERWEAKNRRRDQIMVPFLAAAALANTAFALIFRGALNTIAAVICAAAFAFTLMSIRKRRRIMKGES